MNNGRWAGRNVSSPFDVKVLRILPGRVRHGNYYYRRPLCAWHLPQTQAETPESTERLAGHHCWSGITTHIGWSQKDPESSTGLRPWGLRSLPGSAIPGRVALGNWPQLCSASVSSSEKWELQNLMYRIAVRIAREKDLGAWNHPSKPQGLNQ